MLSAERAIAPRNRFKVHDGFKANPEDVVAAELYDELLDRYEHLLSYAANLQEKIAQQRTDEHRLESDNSRLQHLVEMSENYIELLETALGELGVLARE